MASQLDALRTQARAAELVQTATWLERRKAEDDEANERYRLQARGLGVGLTLRGRAAG